MTIRTDSLQCAYAGIASRVPSLGYPAFEAVFEDWQVIPVIVHSIVVGAILQRGGEVHISLHPRYHKRHYLRGILREHLRGVIDQHGLAFTRVEWKHDIGHRMARLCGFHPVGRNGAFVEYELKEERL